MDNLIQRVPSARLRRPMSKNINITLQLLYKVIYSTFTSEKPGLHTILRKGKRRCELNCQCAQIKIKSANAPGTKNFTWRRKDNVPTRYGFSGDPGVKAALDITCSPLEILSSLVTDELLEHIVRETNWYAVAHSPAASSHMGKWTPTSRQEVLAYLGIRVVMGLWKPVNYRDFWSTNRVLRHELVAEVMTRDRFDQLTTHLHFSHLEEGAPLPEDSMWKLQPIVNSLNDSFRSVFVPGQDIAIDESLCKFRGRLGFKTYNPTKRARFRLKVYKLSASTGPAAGYTSCFEVYTGKDRGDIPSFTKVVLHLMKFGGGFLGKGYQLFVDNWYTLPTLFHLLQSHRTNAVGTARLNRKFMPKNLVVRRKGDIDYRSSKTAMLALLGKDRSHVTMLSTVHTAAMDGDKPLVVKDYNVGMKGVDVGDQMASYYPTTRRSRVWYKKVFFFLYAWADHHALGSEESQKAFRVGLASELLGQFREGTDPKWSRTLPKTPPAEIHTLRDRRFVVSRIPAGRRRRCRMCSMRGRRRSSKTYCSDCNAGLCT
ncbi:piggyBac transposable element-derived protein 4-like [Penaeus indicus]|uniref:piggyBac transposable element-derived protein 4-like n=1 Tax=Penaeus indicus TaxID=29960 RepID=UPI00300D0ED6